jgi:uncharacterized membrane protein (UPF0127 family)
MNRFVSNFILGFFALALMAVYSFAKQPTVYSMMTRKSSLATESQADTAKAAQRVVLPNGTTVAVTVADTPEAQEKGLAGVERLQNNAGMLFVFAQDGTYPMWMKDMKMPIDMLWLDDQGKVVHLAVNVPVPKSDQSEVPTYVNDQPAKYVLELPAGEAEKAGVKEGVQLVLS